MFRWERETLELWLRSQQRLILTSELRSVTNIFCSLFNQLSCVDPPRLPRGEKCKPVKKREVARKEVVETDLKEIGHHNYDIFIRKLSANLARKI